MSTIAAISTAPGMGGIAVIRISGSDAFEICDGIFVAKNKKKLVDYQENKVIFGVITENEDSNRNSSIVIRQSSIVNRNSSIVNRNLVDEVLVSVFRAPHSFTGEDTVEISCHGSIYIQKRIVELLIENGAKPATAGEFTQRAFLNGKMDLSQAEAVADLIQSENEASQCLAMKQLRGGVSNKIKALREQLLNFSALLELELDFSEEDIEFADRKRLKNLLQQIESEVETLLKSFKSGNAVKNGIPVAIIGAPNVGKSTLLNALLDDDRALVSEIPGTTRDTVEDEITLNGTKFRFIDTAGIRETDDYVEVLGIERSLNAVEQADIVLIVQSAKCKEQSDEYDLVDIIDRKINIEGKTVVIINNKIDLYSEKQYSTLHFALCTINVSAKNKIGIDKIIDFLKNYAENLQKVGTTISNIRHFEALSKAKSALEDVRNGFETGLPSDIVAIGVKYVLQYLGELTGEIASDEILNNIFGQFCIGK
ncbi:tRNA modification GTPase MnmE [Bacteroidia bacterium]|nr:tRNA modification GTPase MnmE [Bacteroidia bacterium]GHV44704.1 tRNA modification GTPase MnmE [Bacteroidia bacterium]